MFECQPKNAEISQTSQATNRCTCCTHFFSITKHQYVHNSFLGHLCHSFRMSSTRCSLKYFSPFLFLLPKTPEHLPQLKVQHVRAVMHCSPAPICTAPLSFVIAFSLLSCYPQPSFSTPSSPLPEQPFVSCAGQ